MFAIRARRWQRSVLMRGAWCLCLTNALAATSQVVGDPGEAPYQTVWSRQIGTTRFEKNHSVAVSGTGSVYISGYTEGSLFSSNAGGSDAFLAQYDSAGNRLWSLQIGTSGDDVSHSVAVDSQGNAYISGYTYGNLGGTSAGSADVFLAKVDSAGSPLWSRQIGTSSEDVSRAVAVDGEGNAYISGYTYGSLGATNAGGADAFLAKYDAAGNPLWSRQFGTSSDDFINRGAAAVDSQGNAYISGYTYGSLQGTNAGAYDAFLTKYDSAGNPLWTRQFGTDSRDTATAVAVDSQGNVYTSGYSYGDLFGTNAGAADAFLVKRDSAGNLLWSREIKTSSEDISFSMAVDSLGSAYLSGYTAGDLGGPNAGGVDPFLAKYDSDGNPLWSRQIGTSSEDVSHTVAVDSRGNAYIGGYTTDDIGGPNAGGDDAFLVKFSTILGDMNGDGSTDNFDIQPLELALTDRAAYSERFPLLTNFELRGDANRDGTLDNFDIQPFENLLTASSALRDTAVPEPSAVVLAGFGLLGLIMYAKHRRATQLGSDHRRHVRCQPARMVT